MFMLANSLLFIAIQHIVKGNADSGREYKYTPADNYPYSERPCSHCNQGGCRFRDCGKSENDKREENDEENRHEASCGGGKCEYIDCVNPTCEGGACAFINCLNATCSGGGCHHVHPLHILKASYCDGGGCMLNGRHIPSRLEDNPYFY